VSQCLNPNCLHQNHIQEQFCQRCGAKLLLRDRYRAIKPLSAGSFGRTFVAIDEDKPSQPLCVIKQFFPQTRSPQFIEKAAALFKREAQQLEELGKHPQIPELFAYFIENNHQYLIQEYIKGIELSRELKKYGVFNEKKLLKFLQDILQILQFIHAKQIIHRDIKPDNIIRRSRHGQLVLVDFGAVKDLKLSELNPSRTVIGSTAYAPPEQSQGKGTIASDLYSVGATSLYLLTGVRPTEFFDYSQNQWAWRQHLGQNQISEGLANILDQLLALPLAQRYSSAEEVLADCDWLIAEDSEEPERIDLKANRFREASADFSSPMSTPSENDSFWDSFEMTHFAANSSGNLTWQEGALPNMSLMNPALKKLLASKDPDYIRVDPQFRILESSYGAQRFTDAPELIQVGMDVRLSFPELVGLEEIATAILQGQKQSFELKEISRQEILGEILYFDLYLIGELNEPGQDNALIIIMIDASERVQAELEPSKVANEYSLRNEQLEAENRKLQALTQVDSLTNLANRRAFDDYFNQQWHDLQRQRRCLSLILCDLDSFKQYNDTYGYLAGDQCLQEVAQILQSVARSPRDQVARFGGEEFAMILPDTEPEDALAIAESIRTQLATFNFNEQDASSRNVLNVSCGVASMIPTLELDSTILIQQADQALYHAKEQGGNQVVIFTQ